MPASSPTRPLPHQRTSRSDDEDETWILYQLADSAMPTGGFIVSSGLECLAQQGLLTHLPSYLHAALDTYARSTLPFVGAAYDAQSLEEILDIDDQCDAFLVNSVARRASTAQGIALITLYCRSYAHLPPPSREVDVKGVEQSLDPQRISAFRQAIRLQQTPGHHAIAFGMVCRYWGIRRERAMHACLFLHGRSLLSAAVRLNIIGPYAAQTEIHALRDHVHALLSECSTFTIDQAVSTAPLLDLAQGAHERLYVRLFNS